MYKNGVGPPPPLFVAQVIEFKVHQVSINMMFVPVTSLLCAMEGIGLGSVKSYILICRLLYADNESFLLASVCTSSSSSMLITSFAGVE